MGLTECRRRSPPSLPPPSRSRSLPHQRGNTPSGLEDPSWLPSPPSNRCGSPSRSMTSPVPALSTGSASNFEMKINIRSILILNPNYIKYVDEISNQQPSQTFDQFPHQFC